MTATRFTARYPNIAALTAYALLAAQCGFTLGLIREAHNGWRAVIAVAFALALWLTTRHLCAALFASPRPSPVQEEP